MNKKMQKTGGMGNKHKHRWVKSTDYSIKGPLGHYIACTNHQGGKQIYTLHLANDQGTKQFKTAKEAKDYVDKNWPLNKEKP